MNKNIEALVKTASKSTRSIIGLMSGTSLDGLDIAFCKIKGHGKNTELSLSHFVTVPYNDDFKNEVKSIFSKEEINLQKLCLLNEWIAREHAVMVNECLQLWGIKSSDVDLIASHGQTIYHAPLSFHGLEKFGNGTLQIGDGDHLAVNTGIITISDFRQKHIAAGGEGAPLAAYGDYLLFKEVDTDVILLNIGGISNISFLPADNTDAAMFSSDVGPGNTLMDALIQKHFPGKHYDENGAIAKEGKINEPLLKYLLKHSFFEKQLPKTTGPELFNLTYVDEAILSSGIGLLSIPDLMATLNCFTGKSIVAAIQALIKNKSCKIYVSGGGIHNPLLMDYLKQHIKGAGIYSTDEKNINPDAKEAILFAILANECVAGESSTFAGGLKNFPSISMGKISFPF